MFQRRLMVFIAVLVLMMGALLCRLAWLQLIRADAYLEKTEALFKRPPRWLETVRGNIYDCKGRALATVEASYQLGLHYNLTRLYDPRFWNYQIVRAGRLKKNRGRSREQVELDVDLEYQDDLDLAEGILAELAGLCHVSQETLRESIGHINDRLFDLQTLLARKAYCRKNEIAYVIQPNMAAIRDDFSRLVPDARQRESLIGKEKVAEMLVAQPVLRSISREIALSVEERFGQTRLGKVAPVVVVPKKTRNYPYRDVACHLIGHLGPVGVSELSGSIPPAPEDFQAYFAFDRRGDRGVESLFESLLRGQRGWEHKRIDGEDLEEPARAEMGTDVTMTLDIELQKDIQHLFESRSYCGAAVVIDVVTGCVRAMVSVPTYDLNTYYQYDFYNVINDPDDPLMRRWNRALSVDYQPGSTIKPIILLGALERDVVQESDRLDCDDSNKNWVGSPTDIHNHGLYNATDAVRQSCNFYFIKVGEKFGADGLVDWLGRMGGHRRILAWPEGFGDRAIRAFGETVGHYKPIGSASLRRADLRFVAIGRGAMDGSLLQVANSTATIARYGLTMAPTLIQSPQVFQEKSPVASQHHARIVEDAMAQVVADPLGSGYAAFDPPLWEPDEVIVYGKTGSTKYSLFTCYAKSQIGDDCLAVAVVVEVDRFGSEVAAPLTRMILKSCAEHDYLPETLSYLNEDEFITY